MAQIKVLKQLVDSQTNSITIIADTAQRIFKSGFTWKDVDLNFKGRTKVLKNNFRSTINISKAAQSLLSKDKSQEKYTEIMSARRSDHIPQLHRCPGNQRQKEVMIDLVKSLSAKYDNVAILHRTMKGVGKIEYALNEEGIDNTILHRNCDYKESKVYVSTLSSIKGLEFGAVLILDCNADVIPLGSYKIIEDDELHESTERRLLYTAMTRAREELHLFTSNIPSMFIDDIDKDMLEDIKE